MWAWGHPGSPGLPLSLAGRGCHGPHCPIQGHLWRILVIRSCLCPPAVTKTKYFCRFLAKCRSLCHLGGPRISEFGAAFDDEKSLRLETSSHMSDMPPARSDRPSEDGVPDAPCALSVEARGHVTHPRADTPLTVLRSEIYVPMSQWPGVPTWQFCACSVSWKPAGRWLRTPRPQNLAFQRTRPTAVPARCLQSPTSER